MVADKYHTPLVKGARIILPVIALGLLSTLFLLARTVNPDDAIPFAEVDVSTRAKDQQLTSPRFAGVSREGTEFALTAARALPDAMDPRMMSAEEVVLTLADMATERAMVQADMAQIDTGRRTVLLQGDVVVETSTGYRLTTPQLEGSLGRLDIHGRDGVVGDGPLGRLRAGEMHLTDDDTLGQRLLFTGGVDLLYVPPTE